MLKGELITLRPVLESDIDQFYAYQIDLDNRGEFWGRSFRTRTEMHRDFTEHGFWSDEYGVLALADQKADRMVGQIAWYNTVQYLNEIELGYILYDQSQRRKGCTTEALDMFTNYLFDIKPVNRIRLSIATENGASRRVAEKAGYVHEATQRGAGYRNGRFVDVELYATLRGDRDPQEG